LVNKEEAFLREEWEKTGLSLADWLRFAVYEKGDVIHQFDEATNSYSAHHMSRVRLKTPEELEEYDRMLANRSPEEIARHNQQIAAIEDSREIQGL
jgi:8-oxo-dGTP pyrophosphatase MutT (NUDIX family)